MSKHQKEVRRERMKTERQRRSALRIPDFALRKGGGAALAAAAAIAAGTQAYASPVRFDNPTGPEHFVWFPPETENQQWLDMTLPAAEQPEAGPFGHVESGFRHTFDASYPYSGVGGYSGSSGWTSYLEVDDSLSYPRTVGVDAGVTIPSGNPWSPYGFIEFLSYGLPSVIPEGEPTYLGTRFNLGVGWHYGWIGVVRSGLELDAFAWGYETQPGVAIPAGAPEPGTLALLAFGAAAVARRRRT